VEVFVGEANGFGGWVEEEGVTDGIGGVIDISGDEGA
jgi:hypothetical protein